MTATEPARAVRAVIDLDALRSNLARVRLAAPRSRVMAIIKADAYGHGMLPAARALSDADAFGVACLQDGLDLRGAGITQPITVLEGFFCASELPLMVSAGLAAVVHHPEQVDALERTALEAPLPVWIKIDTGMHRLGFEPQAVRLVWERLQGCPWVEKPLRLMTHLACADERGHPLNRAQQEQFYHATAGLGGERSIANSAAVLAWPAVHADWVRPGIMLYGISPFPDDSGHDHGLKPVMTLSSRLMALRRCKRGQAIGYGASWTCPEDMLLGLVSIGYGDGYPRHVTPGTPLLVNGRRAPLVGRVSMDMLYVDLSSQPEARIGDPVVLWGQGLAVEEIARCAGTIPYELVCQMTRRVKRVVVGEE